MSNALYDRQQDPESEEAEHESHQFLVEKQIFQLYFAHHFFRISNSKITSITRNGVCT